MALRSRATRWLRKLADGSGGRGRQRRPRSPYASARDIVGPTGNLFSRGWDEFEQGHAAYIRSFEPRVPPSIHISHRDMTRANVPIPLVERCLEDLTDNEDDDEQP